MKIKERGRAKYRPLKNYEVSEVKRVLLEKIAEEQAEIQKLKEDEKIDTIQYIDNKLNVVSLFSGCGGLDLGVEFAGLDATIGEANTNRLKNNYNQFIKYRYKSLFHTICSIDLFKEANQTYHCNFPDSIVQIEKDIRKIKSFPVGDIVLGGFPCPGFSEAGPRLIDDERNFLYIHFIRSLIQTQPLFFIAENVKGLLTLGKGEVLKQIIQDFETAGYKVKFKLVNARDFGVPQNRERVFIVGVRKDIDFEYNFPDPTHGMDNHLLNFRTLKDSIGDLEEDPGEWYEGNFSSIYLSRNRKKNWDDQSFTIQASGRQAPLHPSGEPMRKTGKDQWELPGGLSQHRRLSTREIARIQTFPDWFKFSHGLSDNISKNGRLNKVYKQIGNAVPVDLARAIARPIAEWVIKNYSEKTYLRV
ncbi:DNA cytosine methyltransferase [Virgibacillus ndiopensis]|uniref:DNA cytosine methyltransferase n=1 Tax=Virgibacillus ndiopensis TaxID=2004408 RepID=UPI000C08761A|nr:DNA cytosine methyltransferase [Virgibacillus ndiopensis]